MRDPYECLAVPRTATAAEIGKSFRQLAKQLHPDANSDPMTTALFVEINAAHEILGDEEKRRAFDRGDIDTTGSLVPIPRRVRARRRRTTISLVMATLTLAGISTVMIQRQTSPRQISAPSEGSDAAVSDLGGANGPADTAQIKESDRSAQPEARLVLQQNDSYASGDTIPLGLQVSGESAGLAVEITGLPPGTTLSSGRPMGQGGWRIVARNVGNAMIHPPSGFSGAVDFTAELRLADDAVIDRGTFHLAWTPVVASAAVGSTASGAAADAPSDKVTASAPPTTEPNATQHSTEPRLDREQIELLIGRSQKLMNEGDFQAARTLLQRAAEAHDARAALALGATFDPIMLAILQARGIAGDVAMARYWYKKASELGSEEADHRLKLLAPASADEAERISLERMPLGRVTVSRLESGSIANKTGIE